MPEELDEPVFRSWEEYWEIAVRRRWWILLPMFAVWAAVWSFSWFLPVTYQSESVILVEQQKVPDQYVMPNVNNNLQNRLQSLTEQILSRTRLQELVDRLQLYRNGAFSADAVDEMRNDIKIDIVSAPEHPGDYTAFKLRYSASSPKLAQQVNSELTSLFIAENDKTQRQLSENTTEFLDAQLAEARTNMAEQEAKVAAFKEKHLGELPSQLESNMQILGGLQSQLQGAQQTLDAAGQQRLYLESLLQQYQSAQASLASQGAAADGSTPPQTLEGQLIDMRLKLQDLQARYTNDHPDVRKLKAQIAEAERLKKQTENELAARLKDLKSRKSDDPPAADPGQETSTPMMQLESQLKANQMEISNAQKHQRSLESQIAAYQARLNVTPETEQELTAISRGYEESKSNYNSLLQKQMQSQLATSLERRQQGEQFRVIDPPSLPKKPSSVNYLRLSLGGLVAGLALGVGLTILLEMINVRVRQEKDLLGIVPVGILVGIPHLSTPGEAQVRVLRRWREYGMVTALVLLIAVGNLYAFLKS